MRAADKWESQKKWEMCELIGAEGRSNSEREETGGRDERPVGARCALDGQHESKMGTQRESHARGELLSERWATVDPPWQGVV